MQLLSDLHLETETFVPQPAPGAELLVLAGDIDATWARLDLFANWPVPVLMVAGNHEFDGREVDEAWPAPIPRLNRLAVAGHCGLSVFTEGRVALVAEGDRPLRALPVWSLCGPRRRAVTCMNLGPVRTVEVLFHPEAFALLTGVSSSSLMDSDCRAAERLPADWSVWPAAAL